MMRWFYLWLSRKCADAQTKYDVNMPQVMATSMGSGNSLRSYEDGMNFQIYPATGGFVLEYSKYDLKTDRTNRTLHIIPDDQDLGTSIAHVITIEMLRK